MVISTAMYFFSAVLIPFVLAIFLYYCLSPVIEIQMKWMRLPRLLAILTTILLGCGILFSVGLLVLKAVNEIEDNREEYQIQIKQLSQKTLAVLPLERFGINSDEISVSFNDIPVETTKMLFKGTVSGIMAISSKGILVVIFLIFILAGKDAYQRTTTGILYEIESQTKQYIRTLLFTSGATGLLVGLTLSILGVKFAYMFGFFAFFLNFIPNIGSIIATMLPIPIVFLNPELSMTARLLAIAIPAAIQFVVGNIIQPKIVGKSLDLHPITILMSLIFFGIMWGIVGMFLATPIIVVVKILLGNFDYTRSIANLLAGRIEAMKE